MPEQPRILMLFGMTRLSDMLGKGNIWYVSHYREGFDRVICVYLVGEPGAVAPKRDTDIVSIGSKSFITSVIAAPFRLWRTARARQPTHFLTADILTSWWTAGLLRVFRRARVVVMPVCTPDEIYRNSGRTFSGLPKVVENLLIWASFACASRILVAENSPATRRWLASTRFRHKVVVAKATPEELPSIDFLSALDRMAPSSRGARSTPVLAYVGRLEAEKLVDGLIDVAAHLRRAGVSFELRIIGNGTLDAAMKERARCLGVDDCVKFFGFRNGDEVAELLAGSDIFLSTLTGTALKEAALAKLAVVAYAIDYVPDLLTHEENVLLVPSQDTAAMADAVVRLLREPDLHRRIASNLNAMARSRWTPDAVKVGLGEAFEGL